MSDVNPYQAPVADRVEPPTFYEEGVDPPLASRGARFGASLIDAFAVGIPNAIILWSLGLFNLDNPDPKFSSIVASTLVGLAGFAAIQWYFLRSGQTIGKRLLGLRMVDMETNVPPSAGRLLGLRYVPTTMVQVVPLVGAMLSLVNVLWIFGSAKRCLHDYIANTKVILAAWSPPSSP